MIKTGQISCDLHTFIGAASKKSKIFTCPIVAGSIKSLFIYFLFGSFSLRHSEESTYNFEGNEIVKLAAATVISATMMTFDKQCAELAVEVVSQQHHLNGSFLWHLCQSLVNLWNELA